MEKENRASVLIVDDNPANLMVLDSVLGELGLNLVKARSGTEALRFLLEREFAVIILDVNMPDMSGFEAARLIRQRPRSQHTPILFVTAISQSDDSAIEGYGLGAVDYICTPVAPEVIQAKIRVFVDLFTMNHALQERSSELVGANQELVLQLQEIQRLNRELETSVEARDREIAERTVAEAALRDSEARLKMLHEIDRAILAARSSADIAGVAVRHIRKAISCDRASVLEFDWGRDNASVLAVDAELATQLSAGDVIPLGSYRLLDDCRRGRSAVLPDLAAMPEPTLMEQILIANGVRSYAEVPLMAGEQLIAVLDLGRREPGNFSQASLDFARQVGDSLAVAIQNARLHEQVELSRKRLQTLSRRLVEIQEGERRAIARELHDEAAQALTSLMLGLGTLERENGMSAASAARVRALKQVTDGVMEGLHRLAADLRPASLDTLGLVPALRQYLETAREDGGFQFNLTATGLGNEHLPVETETTLYRVVQEAVTNVLRHAHASRVEVSIDRKGPTIELSVADDGIGFDVPSTIQNGRLGLLGMRERTEMLGGTLEMESAPGRGTKITAQLPCAEPVSREAGGG